MEVPMTRSEEIRRIAEHPDYMVSDFGNVYSAKKKCLRKLKPFPVNRYGHLAVDLCGGKRGLRKVVLVHHLVLEAFIGPRPKGTEACHFPDRDPGNNKLENLRWDTPQRNAADKVKHGTQYSGENHPSAIHTNSKISRIKKDIRRGLRVCEIAKKYGIGQSTVCNIKAGRIWKSVF